VLLYLVFRNISISDVLLSIGNASSQYILPVCIVFVSSFILRAHRWRILFEQNIPLRWIELFKAQMIGYLANNVLPARAGEIVRAYILGNSCGIAKSKVFGTVIVERIMDLLSALLLLAVLLLVYPLPLWVKRSGILLSLILLAGVGFLLMLISFGESLVKMCRRFLKFLPDKFLQKLIIICRNFIEGVKGFKHKWGALQFSAYTASIWVLEILFTLLIARSFGIFLSFGESMLVILLIGIGAIIPSAPGSIGTYELFGISALKLLGITGSEAVGFILVMHAAVLLGTSLLGAGCIISHGYNIWKNVK